MDNIMAIQEIALSGGISLIGSSRSTIYRRTREINQYLEHNEYNWRVKADYQNCLINVSED